MTGSDLEETLLYHIRCVGLEEPVREYKFHPTRKWLADFAWPTHHLIVEVEGGIYRRGRHVRPLGYAKDCEKYNAAQMLGYMVLRFTPDMVRDGIAINQIEEVLKNGKRKHQTGTTKR